MSIFSRDTAVTREWALVLLLTLIFIAKGVMWSLAFPLWQGPDEDDHYAVIQFIGENGRLPDVGDEILPDEITLSRELADVGRLDYNPERRQGWSETAVGLRESEFAELPASTRSSTELGTTGKLMHATPLYYMLAAVPYRLIGYEGDLLVRAHWQRLWVVLVSSPIVLIAYATARLLFPTNALLRLTIPTLVAFQPQLTAVTAIVTVDGFYFVCYSLLIYLSLLVLRDGLDWRYGLMIGAAFAAGVLSKPTLTGIVPPIALLVLYDFWRRKGERWTVVWSALLMNVVILIPVGWWMQRSLRLNQDLFYFNPVLKGHRIIENPFYDYTPWQHMLDYYQSVWGGIFTTWWAHFGWLDTPVAPWVYHVLRFLTFAAIVGLSLQLWRRWRARPSLAAWQQGQRTAPLVAWILLTLIVVLPALLLQVYDLTFWWEYGNGRGLQGRYWLGTMIPMLILFVVGLLYFVPRRWHAAAHVLLRGGMILFNLVALLGYVLPRYYL
ncbi:MAG: glycosyltransferase family 39 protein [Anaerolineales bacterium]|nr:glycosyltransferase family 39 protein [Anaerolineales bacterium]